MHSVRAKVRRCIIKLDEDVAVLKAEATRITVAAASSSSGPTKRHRHINLSGATLKAIARSIHRRVADAITLLATTLRASRNYTRTVSSGSISNARNDAEVVMLCQATLVTLRTAKALQEVLFQASSRLPLINNSDRVGALTMSEHWAGAFADAPPDTRWRKRKDATLPAVTGMVAAGSRITVTSGKSSARGPSLATSAMKYATMQFSEYDLDYKAAPNAQHHSGYKQPSAAARPRQSLKSATVLPHGSTHLSLSTPAAADSNAMIQIGEDSSDDDNGDTAPSAISRHTHLMGGSALHLGRAGSNRSVLTGSPHTHSARSNKSSPDRTGSSEKAPVHGGKSISATAPHPVVDVPPNKEMFANASNRHDTDENSMRGMLGYYGNAAANLPRGDTAVFIGVGGVNHNVRSRAAATVDRVLGRLRVDLVRRLALPLATLLDREQIAVTALLEKLLANAKQRGGVSETNIMLPPVVGESASTPRSRALPEQLGRRDPRQSRQGMASSRQRGSTVSVHSDANTVGTADASEAGMRAQVASAAHSGSGVDLLSPSAALSSMSPWQALHAYYDTVTQLCDSLQDHMSFAEAAVDSMLTLSSEEMKEAITSDDPKVRALLDSAGSTCH